MSATTTPAAAATGPLQSRRRRRRRRAQPLQRLLGRGHVMSVAAVVVLGLWMALGCAVLGPGVPQARADVAGASGVCPVKDLLTAARQALQNNADAALGGGFAASRDTAPYQWHVASMMAAYALSHFKGDRDDMETAATDLLNYQWNSGMLPLMVFEAGATAQWVEGTFFPGDAFWGDTTAQTPEASPMANTTGGLMALPFHSTAAWQMFGLNRDGSWLQDMYDLLYPWHKYIHTKRVDQDGYIVIYHPWESAIPQQSPFWINALQGVIDEVRESNYSIDIPTSVSSVPGYPGDVVFTAEMYIAQCIVDQDFDDENIQKKCPFLMRDVLTTAVLLQADVDLREINKWLNDDEDGDATKSEKQNIDSWISQSENSLANLFNSTTDFFLDQVTLCSASECEVEYISPVCYADGFSGFLAESADTDVLSTKQQQAMVVHMMTSSTGCSFMCSPVDAYMPFSPCVEDTSLSPGLIGDDDEVDLRDQVSLIHNYFASYALKDDMPGLAGWIANATVARVCNTSINADKAGEATSDWRGVFSEYFAANTLDTSPYVTGENSTLSAAVLVNIVMADVNQKKADKPPVGHAITMALVIIELIIAFGVGISCVIFSMNMLKRVRTPDQYDDHALFDDVRSAQQSERGFTTMQDPLDDARDSFSPPPSMSGPPHGDTVRGSMFQQSQRQSQALLQQQQQQQQQGGEQGQPLPYFWQVARPYVELLRLW